MDFRRSVVFLLTVAACLSALKGFAGGESRVLHLGDSLSMGPFGPTRDTVMTIRGITVPAVVAGGASARSWLEPSQENRIRVARGIAFDRRATSAADRPAGSEIALEQVPLPACANLKSWQIVDQLRPTFELHPIDMPALD